ncbi:MAG: hypothetical protein ABJ370_13290 [Paracoccaceae bacterium]
MSDRILGDLNEPVWFEFSGHKDAQKDIEENVNSLSGKMFLTAIKNVFLDNGWSESTERYDSEISAEDWGWYVFLQHEGALMMLGTHVLLSLELSEDEGYADYLKEDWIDCGLSVRHFHKRTLIDRLRGRNKADPAVHEKAFLSIWHILSSLDYIRNLSNEPLEGQ